MRARRTTRSLSSRGETIITGAGRKVRVLAVVPVEEEVSPYVRPLQVESL